MFDTVSREVLKYNTGIINDRMILIIDHLSMCNYYDTDEFVKCEFKYSISFSILHMNIHSIQLHIDEHKTLLNMLKYTFHIITISESQLKNMPIINIEIPRYQTPCIITTEAGKGGTMI